MTYTVAVLQGALYTCQHIHTYIPACVDTYNDRDNVLI